MPRSLGHMAAQARGGKVEEECVCVCVGRGLRWVMEKHLLLSNWFTVFVAVVSAVTGSRKT